MQILRRFLNPGWVIGLLAVVLFAWLCFSYLAPWQLGKSDDLDARNSRLIESVEADPAPLWDVVSDPQDFTDREWRLVTAHGHWQPQSEGLLRLRAVEGEPVYYVLTVFALDDGREILVNRGHIPVGENHTVPDYPAAPTGPVDITARVRAAEVGEAEPVLLDGLQAVRMVDPAVLGDALDSDVVDAGYLQLTDDQPGSLTPAQIPAIENGPYLSYGLQWLAFGVMAPLALLYFAWSEIRARRRDAEEQADSDRDTAATAMGDNTADDDSRADATAGAGAADSHSGQTDATNEATEVRAREQAMRARYGQRDDAEKRRALQRSDRLRH